MSLAEINQNEQRRQLSKAYSEVLGIQKYEDLKTNLEYKQDEYRKNIAKPAEKQKLNQLGTDITNLGLEIEGCETDISELREEQNIKSKESDEIQIKLVKAGDKMSLEELDSLREEQDSLKIRKGQIQEQLKELFDFIPFALAGDTLVSVSEQLDNERKLAEQKYKQTDVLEKTDKIRQEIEIERERNKISFDIKIRDFYEAQIIKLIKKHFYSDVQEVDDRLQILHEFSSAETNEFNQLVAHIKHNFKNSFTKLNTEYSYIKNQFDVIGRKIYEAEKNATDTYIATLRDKKAVLDSRILAISEKIGILTAKIDGIKEQIKTFKQEQTALRKTIDDSNKFSEREQKTKQLITKLQEFITKFKEQKKESLEEKMLSSLNNLLYKKNFIKKVDVDILTSDDIDIILYDNNNRIIDKSSLSMGERQMYASALLSSLVDESEIEFPVFIDSPMQKFDKKHAENIIKYFYPNVSKQVVIYPLLYKELNEEEYNLLKPSISKTYLINNISTYSSEFLETTIDNFFATYNHIYNANQY